MSFKPPDDNHALTWVIIGSLSAWGGIVRYLMDMQACAGEWRWVNVVSQIIISCFTGLMGGLLSFEAGATIYMTYITAGLFGAMGSSALTYLRKRILNEQKGD